jgi:D-alanine-D-alanine ligase
MKEAPPDGSAALPILTIRMKIAVVYNRISNRVINQFGAPNQEKYQLDNIRRITDGLKSGKHQVRAFEGDKDLIERLEEFMPQVLTGERPGLVFNLSYGIQGQARYTHVPGILEMVGMPYVGSGPLAHSLALDKVVAKVLFQQHGVPTPDFAVLQSIDDPCPDLVFPMIVKPKNEAVSFGLKIVHNEDELRAAALVIFDNYRQPVLVEQYIEGREINIGLIGNDPPQSFPAVELCFGEGGPGIYTYEDKVGKSGRDVVQLCPAPLPDEVAAEAARIACSAFQALGCLDCARVDMRLDKDGKLYVLEINSLPSLGPRGSFVVAASQADLDFPALCNRLVEVASARYFGTPSPPELEPGTQQDPARGLFAFLTERRDALERRVKEWVSVSSRTDDAVGIRDAARRARSRMEESGLKLVDDLTDGNHVWVYASPAGLENGTLLVAALDVPMPHDIPSQAFRRDAEYLYGEGVALSRGPLVQIEFALRAIKRQRLLKNLPVGVLLYADEGNECRYSAQLIQTAARRAKRVLSLRPGNAGGKTVHQRRGQKTYELVVETRPRRLGQSGKVPSALRWIAPKIVMLSDLSQPKRRIAVALTDIRSVSHPQLLPHRVKARIQVSYPNAKAAELVEQEVREVLGTGGPKWILEEVSDRPPQLDSVQARALFSGLQAVASEWNLPFERESSVWPSVAGLVPVETPALCGMGPVGTALFTPHEALLRLSLVQRTLLLAEFLVSKEAR